MSSTEIDGILDKFNSFTQKPTKFLTVQTDAKDGIKNLVKSLYDFTKSQEKDDKKEKKNALPELIIEDFDEEQIWQEIDLQNTECWDSLVWDVANCISNKNALEFPVQVKEAQKEDTDDDYGQSGEDDMESGDGNSLSEDNLKIRAKQKNKKSSVPKKKVKPSIVDDKFFKLNEMEQFLLKEEKTSSKKPESDSENESVDMFEEIDDEDSENEQDVKEVMYNDFFDEEGGDGGDGRQEDENDEMDSDMEDDRSDDQQEPIKSAPKKGEKKVKFADLMPDNESGSEDSGNSDTENQAVKPSNEKKSEFELRQERLQQTITRLEEKNLKEAPWQLKGEIDANKRPQNSLLQEVVDFDLTSRPPPIITEQTTETLEDIIRRRIKDKAWDDVERKDKPVDDQLAFRKQEILDHSKSKMSLAQVYETEYLKQKQALSGENEEEKEPEAHTEVKEAMSKLFAKLDALCHYHYTPKAPQAEVKIVSNIPAISMEEVAPVATSDAALLAPEEVKRKRRGDLLSKDERTQTDKNRERRKKKQLQRKKGPVMKVTDNRNTKKGKEANDKSLKTSKAFFQQLNDDATSLIIKKNKKNGRQ